jgi:hypothetical protein
MLLFVLQGIILEQGTHDELMARPGGAYARLVQAQEKAHTKGGTEATLPRVRAEH